MAITVLGRRWRQGIPPRFKYGAGEHQFMGKVNKNPVIDIGKLPTYDKVSCLALGTQGQDVGDRPVTEDDLLSGPPTMFCATPYCFIPTNETVAVDRRQRLAGVIGGGGYSYAPRCVQMGVVPRKGDTVGATPPAHVCCYCQRLPVSSCSIRPGMGPL